MDEQLIGSAATEGVEGEKVALGDRTSPLLHAHMWCRFCGTNTYSDLRDDILEMVCDECWRATWEIDIPAFDKHLGDQFSRTVRDAGLSIQEFAEKMKGLAQAFGPAPGSSQLQYPTIPGLTLHELEQEVQKLRAGSPSGTVRPAPTDSLRGPSPEAVFHDDLP